jgi:methionyl-tRNA formyltransferase
VRLAVAATAPFGADVLARLAARHEIAFLLTRPDAPRGRGRMLAPPPAKETAERLGIEVHQPARPELPPEPVDAVVVCDYGLLIPSALLEEALWLNVHPSLLPRWRGAAPVERAILAGDEETGVTIHETVEALDAGPIAAQEAFAIGASDDAGSVFARAAEVAVRLLDDVIPVPSFSPQPDAGTTYAEKIGPADRELDLGDPVDAWRRVRALSPHIGAWATLHGRRVIVWRGRLEDGVFLPEEVQPEGRSRMSYDEFLRGVRS